MAAHEESTRENLPWAASIKQTFEANGMLQTYLSADLETQDRDAPHMLLFQRLKDQFNQEALASINEEGSKLKFYSKLKDEPGMEKYLTSITNVKHRVDMTRLRLSCHSLHIETGRHRGTQRQDRICTLCNINTVEDETHVLVNCPVYHDIRAENIHRTILTSNLCDLDKAVKILKSADIKTVAKFIHQLFKTRDIMLDSLASLNDMIEKIEKDEAVTSKIEAEVQKTVTHLISELIKSEHSYKIKKFDDSTLKMVLSMPKPKTYNILSVSENGLKFVLSENK